MAISAKQLWEKISRGLDRVVPPPPEGEPLDSQQAQQYWRERALFVVYSVTAFLGLIPFIVSTWVFLQEGNWAVVVIYVATYCTLLSTLVFYRLPYRLRALMGVGLLFVIGTTSLYTIGPFGTGKMILLFSAILACIVLGTAYGMATLALAGAVLVVLYFMIPERWPEWMALIQEHGPLFGWRVTSVVLMVVGLLSLGAMVLVIQGLYQSLSRSAQLERALRSDIQRREVAERALSASELKYRALVENAQVAIYVLQEGRLQFVNPIVVELSGYPAEDLVGRHFKEFLRPEDQEVVKEHDRLRRERPGEPITFDVRIIDREGNQVWLQTNLVDIEWEGRPATLHISRDITAQRAAEAALRASEERLRYIIKHDPNALAVFDRDLKYLFVSDRYLTDYGVEREEIVGRHQYEVFPETPRRWREVHQRVLAGAVESNDDDRFMRQDGSVTYNRWECRPWYDIQGQIGGIIAYTEVTTERKLAEEALARSRRRYQGMLEIAPIAIWTVTQGKLDYVNPSACRLWGAQKREELLGTPYLDRIHPDDRAESERRMAEIIRLEAALPVRRHRMLRLDGQEIVVESIGTSSEGEEGRMFLGMAQDITDRVEAERSRSLLEEQLRQSQKMEAVGTLAGGVAHEFNNILAAIIGYADLALEENRRGRPSPRDIQDILKSASRAKELVQGILAFSRKSEAEFKTLELNLAVRQAAEMLRRTIPRMVDLELNLLDRPCLVEGDAGQIQQVLLNLGTNAKDAMPGGGAITIATELVSLDEEYCRIHSELTPGDYVRLSVSDTGEGISCEAMEQIFDPFFTTKEVGKGTGLGLSIVFGIIRSHQGSITCQSQPGEGTTFQVHLPLSSAKATRAEDTQPPAPESPTGHETILLVDDEPDLREIGARILESAGYRVLDASSGEEALELYRGRLDEIDLVILDISMPGMGGFRCLKGILAIAPLAKVMIASGYAKSGDIAAALDAGATGYVAKPFRRVELLAAARKVLDD